MLAGALALLDEAERKHVRNPLPDRPIAALKARTWTRHGMLTEALSWVREQKLSPDDDLSYLREFEHLTLARVLIARNKTGRADSDVHAALVLLARLAESSRRRWTEWERDRDFDTAIACTSSPRRPAACSRIAGTCFGIGRTGRLCAHHRG